MTLQQAGNFYAAEPFQPFVIRLADGREVPMHHQEFIMAVPSGRLLIVCPPDDTVNFIDLLLVTDLEVKPSLRENSRRRRR